MAGFLAVGQRIDPKAFNKRFCQWRGISAAMKAGDDQEGIGLNEEKERVGKFLRARPTGSLKGRSGITAEVS